MEANFFLEKLKEDCSSNHFDFYLSAFISAARSVTFMMQKEYKYHDGWQQWYQTKLSEDVFVKSLFKRFNDMRTKTIHTETIATAGFAGAIIPGDVLTEEVKDFIKQMEGEKIEMILERSNDRTESAKIEEGKLVVNGKMTLIRFASEFPEIDILGACYLYYEILESWVIECENRFGYII